MTENFLQVFKKYATSESSAISDYIKHSNQSIQNAQKDFENRIEKLSIGDDWESIIKNNDEEHDKFHHIFPNFFRLSTFIGLYSYFETKLNRLCYFINERKKYRIKLSDLGGENIIEKSKRYLSLVVGLELNSLNSDWMKITDHQKLRNCFVHGGSDIWTDKNLKLEEQRLYSTVKKYPFLEVTPFGIIFINDDQFLLDFVELQNNYLLKLVDIADPIFRQ